MSDSHLLVRNALKAGMAIPAFNVSYLPMAQPVIRAVADCDSFALLEVARIEWKRGQAGGPAAVMTEFRRWEDPAHVRLHLDHIPVIDEDGETVDYLKIIAEALQLGYHSVMVDASRLDLAGNIRATRQVVELAHGYGAAVEAELGAVFGHGDGPPPDYEELFCTGRGFTRVDEAQRFVQETGCDWLSVAVGTVHGAFANAWQNQKKVEARLKLDLIQELSQATGVPLVLHGGSGVRQADLLAGVKCGIAKINVATEIRRPYETTLAETGSVEAAQEAVYQRTVWLLREYFGWAGNRRQIMGV